MQYFCLLDRVGKKYNNELLNGTVTDIAIGSLLPFFHTLILKNCHSLSLKHNSCSQRRMRIKSYDRADIRLVRTV